MSRASRRKALRAEKSTRLAFKKFFHGRDPAHFVFFQKDDSGPAPASTYGWLNNDFDARIVEANLAGQSICMAINASNKGKRIKGNFFKVNAVFIDKDDGPLTVKEVRNLRPAPDLIVRSSPKKFHAYWLVKDCSVEDFRRVQKALAQRFGTDPNICDIGRVMRMPGTFNPKYPDEEPVKLIHIAQHAKPHKLQSLIDGLGLQVDLASTEQANGASERAAANEPSPSSPAPARSIDNERAGVLAALANIPSDERKTWLHVGMALHNWDATDAGFQIWSNWSARSAKFDAATQRSTWDGFKPGGGVTLGTVFHLARLEQAPTTTESVDESSLAERLCELYRDRLRYAPAGNQWYHFDGTLWTPGTHQPHMAAREMVAAMGMARGGAMVEGLRPFRSASGLRSVVAHAQLLQGMHLDTHAFDRAPNLLAVNQGVLDLSCGQWRAARPDDGLTCRAPVDFDPAATCPLWGQFLLDVVQGDAEFAAFLQRALGYGLFGHAKEQKFFLVIGDGGNGKGTLMRTVKSVLGQYAHAVAPNVLARAYSGNPNSPSPALAALQKARFVICTELAGGGLDEAFVKQFAGGDEISARPTYGELVSFKPPGKLWMSTNTMPEIEAGDAAMWRRLVPLPFNANFRGKKANRDLDEELAGERTGILAWLVRGALAYARDGLGTCSAVRACYRSLRAKADSVQSWIDECCRVEDGARIAAGEAFSSYAQYTRAAKRTPLSNKEFPGRMDKKGFMHKRRNDGNYFMGLRLASPPLGRSSA